ncbi:polysaccharide lyase family 7 protein [Vibrio sp. SM6]|uniref:Polysaccharide lyase family 7 protein n=2 Tax=Vibrio agarilyticus TaxID=2726741 RepID=A0A7X8YHQ6_9VIBR|nr:polysaccharide lyase family 7 protein [Vibrio agarilyticus]
MKLSLFAVAMSSVFCVNAADLGVPADYQKFQDILKISKLQMSDPAGKSGNKEEYADGGKFEGVVFDHFYIDKATEAMVFKMAGYKNRSEIRVNENFRVDDANTFHLLSAEFEAINPKASVKDSDKKNDEMTYLQVHNKGTYFDGKPGSHGEGYIPHPLLRVVYDANRSGKKDWYWAVIKNNAVNCGSKSGNKETEACKKAYVRLPIGPIATGGETDKFDIYVGGEQLVINHNGKTVVNHDITYWKDMISYFKAGVYNQFKNGESEAHFHKLTYSVEKQPVIH